ncbi:platelet glycoprotein Ib alpha chain [Pelodytes ibericus]
MDEDHSLSVLDTLPIQNHSWCLLVIMRPLLFLLLLVPKSFSKPYCSTDKNLIKDMVESTCNLDFSSEKLDFDSDTQILHLSHIPVTTIHLSAFKSIPKLVELDLSNNEISFINVDFPLNLEDVNLANNSFDKLPMLSKLEKLVTLDLSNNRIVTVPENAFQGLKDLKELNLRGNKIKHLSEQVFKGLHLLETLDLSFNQLMGVPPHLISELKRLEKFYLRGNDLQVIPDGFFEGVDTLAYVYLDLNPWKCNCDIQYFKEWVEENGHNIYTISNSITANDDESVICSNNKILKDYSTDHCHMPGDGGPIVIPHKHYIWTEHIHVITEIETTPMINTPVMTSTMETTSQETTPVLTTVMETSTQQTTPAMSTKVETTSQETTPLMTTTMETTSLETTPSMTTTMETTSQETTPSMTTTMETTSQETTPEKTTLLKTVGSTSQEITEVVAPDTILYLPTRGRTEAPPHRTSNTQATPVAMMRMRGWLEDMIARHCCFLHLLIYLVVLLLLFLQIVVGLVLLTWMSHSYQDYARKLKEKPPSVKLVRYSQYVPNGDYATLLMANGPSNGHLGEQSEEQPTPKSVLQPGSSDYTSLSFHGQSSTASLPS